MALMSMFQFFILFIFSMLIVTLVQRKLIKCMLSFLSSFFISLQLGSFYFGGSFIDYKFYMHTLLRNEDLLNDFFLIPVLLLSVSVFLLTYIIYSFSFFIDKKFKISTFLKAGVLILCLTGMSLKGGIINHIFKVLRIISAPDRELIESLNALNIRESEYIFPSEIKAQGEMNIIVVVLESMEKGFLQDKFAHLTPNLQLLAGEWTYFDMKPIEGASWTSGSLFTMMTGIPAFFRAPGNKKFSGAAGSKLSSMPLVLHTAGYDLKYLLAAPEFNGLRDMLTAFGFDVKSEREFGQKYEEVPWAGIHDLDLMNEVKKELVRSKNKNQPFALFISTISTHFPDGIYDSRFEAITGYKGSKIETMIAATDYLIGDLMTFLRGQDLLESTAVIILPDHIWMGNTPGILKKLPDERMLYVITNAEEKNFSFDNTRPIYQSDLPKLILQAANIEHNMRFFMDFQNNVEPDKFIDENSDKILSLNEASFLRVHGIEMKRVKRRLKRSFEEY